MTEDDEIADRLLLPPCRPELIWGIPYKAFQFLWLAWGIGLVGFGAIVTGTGMCAMAWWTLRTVTAWDFNAIPAAIVYCRTKLIAARSIVWRSGITLDPLYGMRPPR